MTENGEEVRRGGSRHHGGSRSGSGLRSTVKAEPARPRESEARRRPTSSNGHDGAKIRAAGAGARGGEGGGASSYVNGNSAPQMDEVNVSIGEVDYTDGEMGSVSSSFSGSSPLSSVGSGAGSGVGVGGTRRVSSGSTGGSSGAGQGVVSSNGSAYKVRNKNNGPASSAGSSSNGAGSSQAGNGRGSSSSTTTNGTAQAIPGVAARPAGVPFGASALSKNMPNNGRGRPRGLRPRSSGHSSGSGTPGSAISSNQRVPSFSAATPSSGRQSGGASRSTAPGGNSSSRRGGGGGGAQPSSSATFTEAEAEASEMVAPGVPVEVVVRAAIKIESVMRVLIARGYVRRKLVSEVTAFSLIMERGIEVIKHPFSGKGKAKNVTVNFVSRKGAMLLSWGGKSGVPLETIFGVTKGINTEALRAAVEPERANNCFSLQTNDRTIDFEVDNPWLVLLVVRALRLFLGAHYDTLPAPTFFSHLCVRPRSSTSSSGQVAADSPKQTMVWTSVEEKSPSSSKEQQTTRSTPTERTSGDSASDDGRGDGGGGGGGGGSGSGRRPSPWDRQDGADGDSDAGSALHEVAASVESMQYPPPPDSQAPGAGEVVVAAAGTPPRAPKAGEEGAPPADFVGEVYEGDGDDADRSPGGVMALFSSGGRRVAEQISIGGAGGGPGSIPRSGGSGVEGFSSSGGAVEPGATNGGGASGEADEPLTASQLLATRGMSKRLTLSKKLSAAANNNSGPLKGKRFDLMALPMDPAGQQDRRERMASDHVDAAPKRTQGMSISIGAGYDLPEEKHRDGSSEVETDVGRSGGGVHESGNVAVVDDLNDKLQSLRRLCVPQARPTSFRPGRAPKTMAVKHMALFSGLGGSGKSGGGSGGGGLGSVADMWGDGVRRQYQTDMVRQSNQSVEDVHKRDSVRTAMLVNRSGVHRVTRKAAPPESR